MPTCAGVIGDWHRAIVRGDLEGVVAAHTDDIVMFDVPPPERGVRGLADDAIIDRTRQLLALDPIGE